MTVLGINMTDSEKEKGWADTKPTLHPINTLYALSLSAWKLASKMVDDGRDWGDIENMQRTAQELERMARSGAECTCFLPNQSCEVCRAACRVIYNED